MFNIFLETIALEGADISSGALGVLAAVIMASILVFVLIGLAIYVYSSFAFMAIARKAKRNDGALAWIPFIGKPLFSSRVAKMHWWPLLLLILTPIPAISFIAMIVFIVFSFIWAWKMFEAVGKPGWWVLFNIIPVVGTIIYLILLGVVAWSK